MYFVIFTFCKIYKGRNTSIKEHAKPIICNNDFAPILSPCTADAETEQNSVCSSAHP